MHQVGQKQKEASECMDGGASGDPAGTMAPAAPKTNSQSENALGNLAEHCHPSCKKRSSLMVRGWLNSVYVGNKQLLTASSCIVG
jgi:hypothetical protein